MQALFARFQRSCIRRRREHGRLVGAMKRCEREKLGFANVDEREGTRREG